MIGLLAVGSVAISAVIATVAASFLLSMLRDSALYGFAVLAWFIFYFGTLGLCVSVIAAIGG
jgi:hypothetical protein